MQADINRLWTHEPYIPNNNPHINRPPGFELRRILRADLNELMAFIQPTGARDHLTQSLYNLCLHLKSELALRADENIIKRNFLHSLGELLRDDITGMSLQNDCVLGSDGYTYNARTIMLWRLGARPEYRLRSPRKPHQTDRLSVRPHPVARMVLDYYLRQTTTPLPQLPAHQERRRLLIEADQRRQANQRQAVAVLDQRLQLADREIRQLVDEELGPIPQAIQQQFEQLNAQLDVVQAVDQRVMEHARQEIELRNRELADLQHENVEIQAELNRMGPQVEELKVDAKKLQLSINETRQELAKRKSERAGAWGDLLKIGACVFLSYLTGIYISPEAGGAILSISIPTSLQK